MPEKLEKLNKALTALIGEDKFTLTEHNGGVVLQLSAITALANEKLFHSQDELDKILHDLGFNKKSRNTIQDPQPYTADLNTINENGLDFINRYADANENYAASLAMRSIWDISVKTVGSVDNLKNVLFDENQNPYYPRQYLGKNKDEAEYNIKEYLSWGTGVKAPLFSVINKNGKEYVEPVPALFVPNIMNPLSDNFNSGIDRMHNTWEEARIAAEQLNKLKETLNEQLESGTQEKYGPYPYRPKGFVKE